MLLGFFGKGLQKIGLGRHHTHIPSHRLHNHTGNLVANLIEQFPNSSHIVVLERQRILCQVSGHTLAAGLTRSKHSRARLDQQAVAMTVVTTLEFHNLVTTRKATSRADGAHGSLGTAVHHADHFHTGHKVHHQLGQL